GAECPADAVVEFEQLAAATRRGSWSLAGLAVALGAAGRADEAQRVRDELEARAGNEYVSPSLLGRANAGAGDYERALALLTAAVEHKEVHSTTELNERAWDAVRDDPRFAALVVQVRALGREPAG